MKTVIITGSARGFGYEMSKLFYINGYNVVLNDINEEALDNAYKSLLSFNSSARLLKIKCDVTNVSDISNLIDITLKEFGNIDIFINNAGVNQNLNKVWNLTDNEINKLVDIDIKATILASREIMKLFIKQNSGSLYNVYGLGSGDEQVKGMTMYGTTKRAIRYFTEGLAKEVKDYNITVGAIVPSIMVTNFMFTSLGDDKKIELDEKTKKIYNILGDRPETIAQFMVKRIIKNKRKNPKFTFLTKKRAMWRFFKALFSKRDLFKEN
ncbi:MAG: SDR family oxidoreductase [Acholeplasmatales bacterium]|nr:SDR family oxidoreductase [Acholeplasmatales bacterium]